MKQLLHGKTESNKPHIHVTNTTQSLFPGQSASLDFQQIKPKQAHFPVIHYIVQFHPQSWATSKKWFKKIGIPWCMCICMYCQSWSKHPCILQPVRCNNFQGQCTWNRNLKTNTCRQNDNLNNLPESKSCHNFQHLKWERNTLLLFSFM